ncbi:MAG: FAD-binding protein [Bacteroidetes bacterium]|nr:FAD-binding protein [Bacteroidota bacterium]
MKRRKFLRNTGIVLAGTTIAGYAGIQRLASKIDEPIDASMIPNGSKVWSNWSGNQSCTPKEFFIPKSELELAEKLRSSTEKMRIVGAGHSFSPVVPSNEILSSLKELNGIVSYDIEKSQVVVKAGTHLYQLTPQLHELGLAFSNLGDIDRQTVGGAVSTSTHGTGSTLRSISSAVIGFKMVTAEGAIVECSADNNAELFYGGTVALGALGIVTEYTLQLEPTYKLKEVVYGASLKETMLNFSKLTEENRNFEFFPFLYSDSCVHKLMNVTNEAEKNLKHGFFNDDFWVSSAHVLSGQKVKNIKRVQDLGRKVYTEEERVGYSHQIYSSPRNIRFNEIEYQLPIEKGLACLDELRYVGQKGDFPITYPIEVRTVEGDDFWMSPFYKRKSISISIHQIVDREFLPYFKAFDKVFCKYEGRPHWGKLTYQNKEYVSQMYSKYDDFVALKQKFDPTSRFSNDYLVKLFGS